MVVGKWKRRVRPRVLVIYGEHEESEGEVFSADVVRDLAKEDWDHARFEMYQGAPKSSRQIWKQPRMEYRAFVRRFLPFDYTIDVHDATYGEKPQPWESKLYPAVYPDFPFYFDYASWTEPDQRLKNDLEKLSRNFAVRGVYPVPPYFWTTSHSSKQYHYILVEYYPRNISKDRAGEFLRGMIRILSRYKRTV